ncbi:hypothetical protein NUW54_g3731 [Trametes sanguinea]|uniref:Uncharacterized protein n=1 Tax=Trametes sanguinea TaxID=158606 RepID=A0ACC1PZX3_9APHY|nr:hypothetical protein NUW54_g3731 [Trametes sanguinea]
MSERGAGPPEPFLNRFAYDDSAHDPFVTTRKRLPNTSAGLVEIPSTPNANSRALCWVPGSYTAATLIIVTLSLGALRQVLLRSLHHSTDLAATRVWTVSSGRWALKLCVGPRKDDCEPKSLVTELERAVLASTKDAVGLPDLALYAHGGRIMDALTTKRHGMKKSSSFPPSSQP